MIERQSNQSNKASKEGNDNFIDKIWDYIQQVEEYKLHHAIARTDYPYYQLQECLTISAKVIERFLDKLFARKMTVGYCKAKKT